MKLNSKQISHIKATIMIDRNRKLLRINVTENDGTIWTNDECNFNIYCVDQDYNILWQVKETKTKPVSIFGETDSFCYLGQNDKGEIIAGRFSGFEYKVDSDTGEATRTGFHK